MTWKKVLNDRRYGRFYIDSRILHEYPEYAKGVLTHFIIFRAEYRWGEQAIEYEAASPFFEPLAQHEDRYPLYRAGLNQAGGIVVSPKPLHMYWPHHEGECLRLAHCGCGRYEDLRPIGHRDGNFTYRCLYAHTPNEVGQLWHNVQTGEEFTLLEPAGGFLWTDGGVALPIGRPGS